jgi:hypothetical protein
MRIEGPGEVATVLPMSVMTRFILPAEYVTVVRTSYWSGSGFEFWLHDSLFALQVNTEMVIMLSWVLKTRWLPTFRKTALSASSGLKFDVEIH